MQVELRKNCTTPARESDLEVKIVKKMAGSEHSWKLSSEKFVPHLCGRAIWKSKPLKHQALGTFFELQPPLRVAGAGISIRWKILGRRRSS